LLCQYLRLIRTFLIPSLILFAIIYGSWTIVSDINAEQRRVKAENEEAISRCEKEYEANKCGGPVRVPPALVHYCNDRRDCAGRHRFDVTKGSIAARYLGRLVDEFVGALSARTILTIIALIGCFFWLLRVTV
jgi:hypothetical protein